jgi:hypothetical protein
LAGAGNECIADVCIVAEGIEFIGFSIGGGPRKFGYLEMLKAVPVGVL